MCVRRRAEAAVSCRVGEQGCREPAGAGHGGSHPDPCPAPSSRGLKLFRSSGCSLGDTGDKGRQGRPGQPSPCRDTLGAWVGVQVRSHAPGITPAPTSHDMFDYVELKCNTLGSSSPLPALAGLLFTGRVGDTGASASCRVITPPVQGLQLCRHPCSLAPLLLSTPTLWSSCSAETPAPWPP